MRAILDNTGQIVFQGFLIYTALQVSCSVPLNPLEEPKNAKMVLSCLTESRDAPDLRYYVGDSIQLQCVLRLPSLIDSHFLVVISRGEMQEKALHFVGFHSLSDTDTVDFSFEVPCSVAVFGIVSRIDNSRDSATIRLNITENPDSNVPPALDLRTNRTYASPSLPCTLWIAVDNKEPWQQVTLAAQVLDENYTFVGESLFVWTPSVMDTGESVLLTLKATDNGLTPKASTSSVTIWTVADGAVPAVPTNLEVKKRTSEFVYLVWDEDPLSDQYMVLRSRNAEEGAWEEIPCETSEYVDSTETLFFYQIAAQNYFGTSERSSVVWGKDAVHYAHRIFFATPTSSTDEIAGNHTTLIMVARPAEKPIVVYVSGEPESADTSDFVVSDSCVIQTGDTATSCSVRIADDKMKEEDEAFLMSIIGSSSGFLHGDLTHRVTILDDDSLFVVFYDANGATGGQVPVDSQSYAQGLKATIKGNAGLLTRLDFRFAGWNTMKDGTGRSYVARDSIVVQDHDIVLYAQWAPIRLYGVTYKDNGATGGSVPLDTTAYRSGDSVSVKGNSGNLVKGGFSFIGWNTAANGSGYSYRGGEVLTVDSTEVVLYAQWSAKPTYSVIYDENGATGGSVPASEKRYVEGSKVKVLGNIGNLLWTGRQFTGWNTARDGGGTSYAPEEEFTMGTVAVILFAQWEKRQYRVRFDSQRGSNVEPSTVEYNGKVNRPADPQRSGHTFGGWYKETSCSTAWDFAHDSIICDTTLFAKWSIRTHTVSFNSQGGSAVAPQSVVHAGKVTEPAVPLREGYSFSGWFREDSCKNAWVFAHDSIVWDTTLYAKWTSNEVPNTPPKIVTISDDVTVSVFDSITLSCTAVDEDGFVETYQWDFENDGEPDYAASNGETKCTYTTAGFYIARVTLVDDDGEHVSDSLRVTVLQDPPVVDGGADFTIPINASANFSPSAKDSFGVVELYKWDYDGDGTWDDSSHLSEGFSYTYSHEADYNAIVAVRDDDGNTTLDTVVVTVTNSPPTIETISDDITVSINDSVTLSCLASDVDGTIQLYEWDFTSDGIVDYSGETGAVRWAYSTAGTYRATVTVVDDDGKLAEDTVEIAVLQDAPTLHLGSDTIIGIDSNLTLTAATSQAFGTIVKYQWDTDGDGHWDDSSSSQNTMTVSFHEGGYNNVYAGVVDDDGNCRYDSIVIWSVTFVGGRMAQDNSLSSSRNPYVIDKDLVVEQGVSFQLGAGVHLHALNHSKVVLYGSFSAYGSSSDSVEINSVMGVSYSLA